MSKPDIPQTLSAQWGASTTILNEAQKLRAMVMERLKHLLESTECFSYILSDRVTVFACSQETAAKLLDAGFVVEERVDMDIGYRVTFRCGE